MNKVLAHKIRIYPNNKAISYFNNCFGAARFAYNWALDICKKSLADKEKVPSGYDLSKQLNSIKREQYPWMYDVSKWVVQKAVFNIGEAFQRFFKKTSHFPKFKKRGVCRDSFYINANQIKIEANRIRLPKIGWIRMSQSLRFSGKPLSVVISRKSDKYFASIQVELDNSYVYSNTCKSQARVGIDLGVKDLITLSNGEKYKNTKVLMFYEKKLKQLQRQLSKKKKGSKNRCKHVILLSKLHNRIFDIRRDNIHKLTSKIVSNYSNIAIEDLSVSKMVKNRKLAKSVQDSSFYEIRRQLEYKSKLSGSELHVIDRYYPSSKTCSVCGFKKEDLQLSDREWRCEGCGMVHDRDINAARNVLAVAAGHVETENACGDSVRLDPFVRNRRESKKQEGGVSC